jgi:hypothetical protein
LVLLCDPTGRHALDQAGSKVRLGTIRDFPVAGPEGGGNWPPWPCGTLPHGRSHCRGCSIWPPGSRLGWPRARSPKETERLVPIGESSLLITGVLVFEAGGEKNHTGLEANLKPRFE